MFQSNSSILIQSRLYFKTKNLKKYSKLLMIYDTLKFLNWSQLEHHR